MEKEIFGLEINDEGIHWLEKLQKFAAIVLIATIVTTALSLYNVVPFLIEAGNTNSSMEFKWKLLNKLYVFSTLANLILQVTGAVIYYRFSETSKKAIQEKNGELLNQSLRFLYWVVLVFFVHIAIVFVSLLFSVLVKPV